MHKTRSERRSNLKVGPLRQAGQSLDEEIQEIRAGLLEIYLLVGALLLIAWMEWAHHLWNARPYPWIFTLLALATILHEWPRFQRGREKLADFRLGRDGERIVGHGLEELRAQGWRVLHDIVLDGFNLDHVLIGPKGFFAIETKTWRKIPGLPTRIAYDGKEIQLPGHPPTRAPIAQAEAEARALTDLIKNQTGKDFPVRPVVLFPEWYIEKQPHGARVWVLNPKNLPSFLSHERETVSQQDVDFIYARLADFVRTSNRT